MKLAWIEDLLALVEAGNFSRAAILRNVTQPAFSRRIQLLEQWMDAELVDRRSHPMRLTAVAERHVAEFRMLLQDLNHLRNRIKSEIHGVSRVVLAAQHSLTMTRLPSLLQLLTQNPAARIEFNVRAENRDECVALFLRGKTDLLLCMEESDDLLSNRMTDSCRLSFGTEAMIPVSALSKDGVPLHKPQDGETLKLLGFPLDSFLGRIMYKHCVSTILRRYRVEVVHESVFLAGVKEMTIAGLGMAWLPQTLVKRELESGALVRLDCGLKSVTLELGLYRNPRSFYPEAIDRIWALLGAAPDGTLNKR